MKEVLKSAPAVPVHGAQCWPQGRCRTRKCPRCHSPGNKNIQERPEQLQPATLVSTLALNCRNDDVLWMGKLRLERRSWGVSTDRKRVNIEGDSAGCEPSSPVFVVVMGMAVIVKTPW